MHYNEFSCNRHVGFSDLKEYVKHQLIAYLKREDFEKIISGTLTEDSFKNLIKDYLTKVEAASTYQPKGDYLTEHQSLEGYAKTSEVKGMLEGYYTKEEVNEVIKEVDITDQLVDYVKLQEFIEELAKKADKTEIPSLEDYAKESWVEENFQPKGEYVTNSDLEEALQKLDTQLFVVTDTLPDRPKEGNENKIHVVPATPMSAQASADFNAYVEWIWVGIKWEKLGEFKTDINLDGYATEDWVKDYINGLTTSTKFVDLGLPSGLLWADRNLGADSSDDTGLYFAWGETKGYTKEEIQNDPGLFTQERYKFYLSQSEYTKYNSEDELTTLLPQDDAATTMLGSSCRIPTAEDFEELLKNTIVEAILPDGTTISSNWSSEQNKLVWDKGGAKGMEKIKFISKTNPNNFIVFPFVNALANGGEGITTSSPYRSSNIEEVSQSKVLEFEYTKVFVSALDRHWGSPIRAVSREVSLDKHIIEANQRFEKIENELDNYMSEDDIQSLFNNIYSN